MTENHFVTILYIVFEKPTRHNTCCVSIVGCFINSYNYKTVDKSRNNARGFNKSSRLDILREYLPCGLPVSQVELWVGRLVITR